MKYNVLSAILLSILLPSAILASPTISLIVDGKQLLCKSGKDQVLIAGQEQKSEFVSYKNRLSRARQVLRSDKVLHKPRLQRKLRKRIRQYKKYQQACFNYFQKSFEVSYFDTTSPEDILFTDKVHEVAVNYAWEEGGGLFD